MGLQSLQKQLCYQFLLRNLETLEKYQSWDFVVLKIANAAKANVEFPIKVNIP